MPALAGTKTSRRRRWLTAYAPLIIWTIVVLGLGSGMATMSETSRIIRPLLEFLFPSASPETLTFYHGIIRKLAHVFEYALLAILAVRAFAGSRMRYVFAVIFALTVATADEINQSFNPQRTGTPIDVLIDLAGAFAGLLVFRSAEWLFKRRSGSPTHVPAGSVPE